MKEHAPASERGMGRFRPCSAYREGLLQGEEYGDDQVGAAKQARVSPSFCLFLICIEDSWPQKHRKPSASLTASSRPITVLHGRPLRAAISACACRVLMRL
jgi:hypothetical protein